VEPIPETIRAIEELGPFADGGALLEHLVEMGRRVGVLVPDCIALTLASSEHDATFALLASRRQLALLAAIQREADAEADTAAPEDAVGEQAAPDLLDEEAWQRHALANAAPCVATTLTLPLRDPARPRGSITLYGASRQAFTGHHKQLAEILGAWAPGVVTNADLPFRALHEAQAAPGRLRRAGTLDEATRIVGVIQKLAPDVARQRIRDAAARAGISEEQLAEAVIRLRRP
jgi:hypothetical protein